MSNGFGLIHELAAVETQVRRKLSTTQHELDCLKNYVEMNDDIPIATRANIASMIFRAAEPLKAVIG